MSDELTEVPVTDESEVDDPTDETVDPDFGRDLKDGVGFHDEEAVSTDKEPPDLESEEEPIVDEPEEDDI